MRPALALPLLTALLGALPLPVTAYAQRTPATPASAQTSPTTPAPQANPTQKAPAPANPAQPDQAQAEAPQPGVWVQTPQISPDGRTVAFVARGQLATVPVGGGTAQTLSPATSYAQSPVWSPDGGRLAFASNQAGDPDVYVLALRGGKADGGKEPSKAERLTFSSAPEIPRSFGPGGKEVAFTAPRLGDPLGSRWTAQNPQLGQTQLYSVPVGEGGSGTRLLIPTKVDNARWNPQGTRLAYEYVLSIDLPTRQHRGAANAGQLWLFDPATRRHTPFVRDGSDARSPVWSADGQTLYYLSERGGTRNVWRQPVAGGAATQLTFHTGLPVDSFSVSDAGDLALSVGGELQVVRRGERTGKGVEVRWPQPAPLNAPFSDHASTEFAASPKGDLFALATRGDLFLLSSAGQTYRLTQTPQEERGAAISPQGNAVVYASARRDASGRLDWRLYRSSWSRLGTFREQLLHTGPGAAQQPVWSPDGRKVAFVYERREVRVLDIGSGKVTTLYQPGDWFTSSHDGDLEFSWSPDSRYLAVPWRSVDMVQRWAVVPADGSAPLRPVSERLPEQSTPQWTADGTRLLVPGARDSLRTLDGQAVSKTLYSVFMSPQARADALSGAAKATAPAPYTFSPERPDSLEGTVTALPGDFFFPLPSGQVLLLAPQGGAVQPTLYDLRSRQSRALPAVPVPAGLNSAAVDARGETLFVLSGDRVLRVPLTEKAPATGKAGESEAPAGDAPQPEAAQPKAAQPNPAQPNATRPGAGQAPVTPEGPKPESSKTDPAQPGPTKADSTKADPSQPAAPKPLTFTLQGTQNATATYRAAFDQAWLDLGQKFYRADLGGVDWAGVYATYAPLTARVATPSEFAQLVASLSGTLGASHLLLQAPAPLALAQGQRPTQTGSLGVFVDYAFAGPGVRIAEVVPSGPLDRLDYDVRPGDVITEVGSQAIRNDRDLDRALDGRVGQATPVTLRRGEKTWTLKVSPVALSQEAAQNARRVTALRRAEVERLSQGRLAYVYQTTMTNNELVDLESRLLAVQDGRSGVVVDVRSNSGGNTDQPLLTFLSARLSQRFGRLGSPLAETPQDRWRRASALLVDSFSYSDASVFAQAYRDAALGPVVGQPLALSGTALDWVSSAMVPGVRYSLPVLGFYRPNGEAYEGLTLTPDLTVPRDPNAEQAGEDQPLRAAVERLLSPAKPAQP